MTAALLIDETAIEQACKGRRVRLTRPERRIAIARLDTDGRTAEAIAALVHCSPRTVQRHRARRRAERTRLHPRRVVTIKPVGGVL